MTKISLSILAFCALFVLCTSFTNAQEIQGLESALQNPVDAGDVGETEQKRERRWLGYGYGYRPYRYGYGYGYGHSHGHSPYGYGYRPYGYGSSYGYGYPAYSGYASYNPGYNPYYGVPNTDYCGKKGSFCQWTPNCCAGQCLGNMCVSVDGDGDSKTAATTTAKPEEAKKDA